MARLFNVEVFNQSFTGDSTAAPSYVSGSEFNSLLGSAESVKVQIIVDAAGTLPVTVSVAFEYNNAMQDNIWTTGTTTTVTATTFSDLPKSGYISLTAPSDLAAYGRFRVGATQNATVRIIACGGRTERAGTRRAAMKAYEILPPGMMGTAMGASGGGTRVPKAYEIMAGAGVAESGLGGKNGGCGCGSAMSGAEERTLQPSPFGVGHDRTARLRFDVDGVVRDIFDSSQPPNRGHRALSKVAVLVSSLPTHRFLGEVLPVAHGDPILAIEAVMARYGALVPFPPLLRPGRVGAMKSYDQMAGAQMSCNDLRRKLQSMDALLAAIDQQGDPNLRAIRQIVEQCHAHSVAAVDDLLAHNCYCFIPDHDPDPFHFVPSAADGAAYRACLASCDLLALRSRDVESCTSAIIQRARMQVPPWTLGESYAQLLADRYRTVEAIEQQCRGNSEANTGSTNSNRKDSKETGSSKGSAYPHGFAPKDMVLDGDLARCEEYAESLRVAGAALVLYVVLGLLGVPAPRLQPILLLFFSLLGPAVAAGCLTV